MLRLDSAIALIGIGTEEALVAIGVDDLVGFLGSERLDDSVKRDAAKGLGRLGTRARTAIPAFEKAAENSEMWLSQAAKDALEQIRRE